LHLPAGYSCTKKGLQNIHEFNIIFLLLAINCDEKKGEQTEDKGQTEGKRENIVAKTQKKDTVWGRH
jgi:hypothetical protein